MLLFWFILIENYFKILTFFLILVPSPPMGWCPFRANRWRREMLRFHVVLEGSGQTQMQRQEGLFLEGKALPSRKTKKPTCGVNRQTVWTDIRARQWQDIYTPRTANHQGRVGQGKSNSNVTPSPLPRDAGRRPPLDLTPLPDEPEAIYAISKFYVGGTCVNSRSDECGHTWDSRGSA